MQAAENPLFRPGAAPENSACAGVHCLLSTREPETPLSRYFSKLNQTLELQQSGWRKSQINHEQGSLLQFPGLFKVLDQLRAQEPKGQGLTALPS